jgi:tetratricopeptide (TPR) repeat protein
MKFLAPLAAFCVLLLATACTQSLQHLVEAGNRYHARKKYQEASILYRKANAKDKTNADAYYREGLNLLDQNNPVDAAGFFRRAVDLDPKNLDAEVRLSEIYLTVYALDPKKFQSLLPEIKDLTAKILNQNPRSAQGIRLQAFIYLAEQNREKALESFEEANRLAPYSRNVVGWLAQLLAASGQFDRAEQLARGMIAHDKSWGPAYDFLFVQYMQRKQVPAAEQVLRDRVANDPASPVARINYSNYLVRSGRYAEGQAVMQKLLDDPETFPNGHQLMGDFYLTTGKPQESSAEYKAGIDSDPKNKLLYQQKLVRALAAEGAANPPKQVEALNMAKRLASEHPKDLATAQLYASLLLDVGTTHDLQKSVSELASLVQHNNGDSILHFDLARAYYRQHNQAKALTATLEAVRLKPGMLPARILAARIYEDNKQHGKALEQIGIVLDRTPANAQGRLIRAQALLGSKNVDKAQTELEALVKEFPQFADAINQLASLYLDQGNYAKAQEQFEKLWTGVGPGAHPDLRGFIGLQLVKLRRGDWQQAVGSMQELVQKNTNQPDLRYTLANFQAQAGSSLPASNPERNVLLTQAIDNYKAVLHATANGSEVWFRLGTLQRILNQNDAALESFNQAARSNPGNPQPVLSRAMLLESMGQKEKARDAYSQTLGIDPDNVVALNNLAFIEAESGADLDQAMTYAERAKKRDPNNPSVSDTLGYVYYQKNLTQNAVSELKTAVQADPKNSAFRLHLAMALLKQGDKVGAMREAQDALRTADSNQQQKIRSFMGQIG